MLESIKNNNFYTGCIDGEISTYCYQVEFESKPIAFMNLKTIYVANVTNQIKEKFNFKVHIKDVQNYPEWKTIFIYKHCYLIDIIRNLPEEPQTPYKYWIIGKVYGYSDDSIGEFINSKL